MGEEARLRTYYMGSFFQLMGFCLANTVYYTVFVYYFKYIVEVIFRPVMVKEHSKIVLQKGVCILKITDK